MSASPAAIDELKSALGPGGWSDDPEIIAPRLTEWRGQWRGETPLLLLPDTVEAVARAVRVCATHGVAITPQGGNTGLVGGQIPQGEVLLSLSRMRQVRQVWPLEDVMVVEAGVTLLEAQQAAADSERMFPLSLAAEGTATIGGVISTNAGGTAVLRYGVARDLVLGLEAVLPNGEIFHGLKRLRKDNTGYDLKQLLIGAEGTLGVVTAAALKLFPVMRSRATAMVAVASIEDALMLLGRAKAETGGGVEAFELMGRPGLDLVLAHIPDTRDPLEIPTPWRVLIELVSGEAGLAERALERLLESALEAGLIQDAAVAQNAAQAQAMWRLREDMSAAQKAAGGGWKHDVSLPLSALAEFVARADAALRAAHPGIRLVTFGHLGDGNLHYNVVPPADGDPAAFAERREEGARIAHDLVHALDGSISAEHGLGRLKTEEARRYKDPVQIAAMRAVRDALDPQRIMNPRVLF
ncbi:FAD-binding oxidoreductase [Brevundimonas lutea]|uniref:FAD-binding oxidoreductase n=1 Tax=Brevundimonas lutea TaxID=2293980 RepID=UPI000F0178CA|nr:FAD-binding oxidoreductase [Brevundimonas lutea]